MLHFTDHDGWNAIRSQVEWVFRAHQPPCHHPIGAYFTTLSPDTTNLAKKLRIPRRKIAYVFCFSRTEGLFQIDGGRGQFIWFSPNDYTVEQHQQNDQGKTDEGACR